MRKNGKARPETEAFHRRAVERVIAAMRQSLDRTPPLEELAEIALMSPFHFSRTFHRLTGLPPLRFHSVLRIEEAKRLLLFTDVGVSDLCFQVGYFSPGTFCVRFRNAVGLSPSGFRALAADGAAWRPGLLRETFAPPAGGVAGFDPEEEVCGWVETAAPCKGPIFAGLFPSATPEGLPVACVRLERLGGFSFGRVPEGIYRLFAVAPEWTAEPKRFLMYGGALRGSLPPGRLVAVRRGRATAPVGLTLGPPPPTVPPFLTALPALLQPGMAETEQLTGLPWPGPRKLECRESSPGG